MRISGWGSNNSSDSRKERERSAAFQRRHRIGERVTGRVLKRERSGYAWVDFEGLELLANIQSDPEPGSRLLFQIIRLEPDILLQELHVAQAQGDPLGPAVNLFWATRTRFESASTELRKVLSAMPGPEQQRKVVFELRLAEASDLAHEFQLVIKARDAVNALLATRGEGRLDYRPWLLPDALSGEMLTVKRPEPSPAQDQGTAIEETAFSFALPPHGQCEMRLMVSPTTATVRLFLEHTGLAPAFEKILLSFLFSEKSVEFFTPTNLPPEARAGVLAPQLSSGQALPRFARRI
ncbi:hypothetical protein [Desulfovibrio ferrophilus]|uniref:Uncharacterized protein n=1 Tax=Desulfovibrio ferrophilus TaxID=241368 RepID=A0A2Z6AXP1_9BACT|nr:hypothetical protein [Desulfovibrio ferrophilus]BBD07980.1 uncharacterized protein DFE_1254 [Desulfovibrio ferrophilus]